MMKKFILILATVLTSAGVSAQSEKYLSAMKANITAIDSSFKSVNDMQNLANSFERIAKVEKNQWLPYYYAALCQVNCTYIEQDKTKHDAMADRATDLLNKADSLQPNNSEISCLRSMIASSHMLVNPMQRYMEYGMEISTNLETAMQQDPANPRPEYLKGQGLKYTPEQFGGGCSTAKPVLQSALDKFNKFKPASDLHPNWGRPRVERLLSECK